MIRIVVDARLYGPKHTGLGRYTKNLLNALKLLPGFSRYKFILLVYPELYREIKADLGGSFEYKIVKYRHYSLAEQLFLPALLRSLKPDLVHFTHFSRPIFYFGESVVTVHDLIRHFSRGMSTSTRFPLLYWPKYLGYRLVSGLILKFNYLIVPSNFWRDYLISHFHVSPGKIITTYEAADPDFKPSAAKVTNPQNYLVYTGNLYPHKNVDVIFAALKKLPDLKLKIISARNVFSARAQSLAQKYNVASRVEFMGFVPDAEFRQIYRSALALVHPAFLEGFSLTGLEAMQLNCPVISSNSSCLPEIYGKSVLYFDPHRPDQLIKQINNLRYDPGLRQHLIDLGRRQAAKYSWQKTAAATLDFYDQIIKTT